MYISLVEFINDWKNESSATLKLFDVLTDASLNQKVTPGGRTLGKLAWHIIETIPDMMKQSGIEITGVEFNSEVPKNAQEIRNTYQKISEQFVEKIQKQWNDDKLKEVIDLFGEKWSIEMSLVMLVRHEIHHRAQMTILMRQAGINIPGIYGPSKEEWTAYGQEPQD